MSVTKRLTRLSGLSGLALLALGGCAKTQQAPVASVQPVYVTGIISPETQLTPGASGQASLRYLNPSANWSSYTKVIIQPVTFWGNSSSAPDTATQQMLCDYLYNKLTTTFGSGKLRLVTEPGPNTMVLRIALTDATASTPGLRTISVIVPQARLLTALGNAGTGYQAFAGSAQGEGVVTDSMTGQTLAAFVDKTQAGSSLSNASVNQWSDVKTVMDSWVTLLQTRFNALSGGSSS